MRGGGRAPPPSAARTDFTLITECTPESSGCNSVTLRGESKSYCTIAKNRGILSFHCSMDETKDFTKYAPKLQGDYESL